MSQWCLDKWQVRDKSGINEKKKELSSPNGAGTCSGEGEWIFRERKCNFSLDFPAFGPSVRVEPRSKVVLLGKGYAWALVLGSFDNSKR